MATLGEEADRIVKCILLSSACAVNGVALTYFITRFKGKRPIKRAFILQISGHACGILYPIARMTLLFQFNTVVQYINNVTELLLLMIQSFYYFEIFGAFGTFQKYLSPRMIGILQIASPIFCFVCAGAGIFRNILWTKTADPGFVAKVIEFSV
jgi:hypothetical protein